MATISTNQHLYYILKRVSTVTLLKYFFEKALDIFTISWYNIYRVKKRGEKDKTRNGSEYIMEHLKKAEEIIKELIEIAKLLNKLFKECLPLICTLTTLWLLIKYGF